MGLSLALWKAVSDRYAEMWALWDGGRVLGGEREKITALVWGRLDTAGSSLPEACRLSDALAAQLRMRLALDAGSRRRGRPGPRPAGPARTDPRPGGARAGAHPRRTPSTGSPRSWPGSRASPSGPAAAPTCCGMLAPLEQDAATYERDLIVGNAAPPRRPRPGARRPQAPRRARAARGRARSSSPPPAWPPSTPRPGSPSPTSTRSARCPTPPTPSAPTSTGSTGSARRWASRTSAYAAALAQHQGLVDLLDGYVRKARGARRRRPRATRGREAPGPRVLARRPAPDGGLPAARRHLPVPGSTRSTGRTASA